MHDGRAQPAAAARALQLSRASLHFPEADKAVTTRKHRLEMLNESRMNLWRVYAVAFKKSTGRVGCMYVRSRRARTVTVAAVHNLRALVNFACSARHAAQELTYRTAFTHISTAAPRPLPIRCTLCAHRSVWHYSTHVRRRTAAIILVK